MDSNREKSLQIEVLFEATCIILLEASRLRIRVAAFVPNKVLPSFGGCGDTVD